jgi:hypothetical protein
MVCDEAVTVDVDAAFPATSRSVLAAANWNAPARGVVETAEQDPVHDPLTLNVTVLLPLLSTNVPANETVRVELLLVR